MEYIAYLHKDGKSDYGVSFPDFPGVVTAGKTLEEARRLAAEALALHIQGMVDDGETIPEPSSLDDLAGDPAMKGAVAFLVSASAPDALVRVNITARESQMKKIDFLAEAVGMTRSAYMVQAAITTAQQERRPKREKREKRGKRRSAAGVPSRAMRA
jgi:predicted RNase H-like HicB family nuclease